MSNKLVIQGPEARSKVLEGIELVTRVAAGTLGPKGKHVIIERSYGAPHHTKDGVTVVKEIGLANPYHKIGAKLVQTVASKVNDKGGDGTTTASVLFGAIASEGVRVVSANMDQQGVKRGMEMAVEVALEEVKKLSRPISTVEEMCQIATVSANGDERTGKIIAETFEKVGKNGVITVEEATKSEDFEVDIVEGMMFDRGHLSPYFITNAEKMICELENPHVLIVEKKISSLQQILPILENIAQSGKSLLIIAEDVEGEALATLVVNKLRGGLKVVAVKAPGFGDRRKAMLQDIAIVTGGMVVSEDLGHKLENTGVASLGKAKKVIVSKDDTTIVDGSGNKADIDARCAELKTQIEESTSDYDKEKLQERLAKLSGGVAVLRVGGTTEVQVKELKDRTDDALNAVRAAIAEGVVPGGGCALLYASKALSKLKTSDSAEQAGIDIIKIALEKPCKKIMENAGLDASLIVATLKEKQGADTIYDARTKEYVNAYKSGIIDPTKIVRTALESAASGAAVLITTEAVIVDDPEDKKSSAPMGGGGMGGMGGMGDF